MTPLLLRTARGPTSGDAASYDDMNGYVRVDSERLLVDHPARKNGRRWDDGVGLRLHHVPIVYPNNVESRFHLPTSRPPLHFDLCPKRALAHTRRCRRAKRPPVRTSNDVNLMKMRLYGGTGRSIQ
jgi:hypothetical protein